MKTAAQQEGYHEHFFVITGGPGSGKSSLIGELATRTYRCVEEVARRIIQEQMETGGDALPWKDTLRYRDIMVERSLETYHAAAAEGNNPVFFDRGIPDVIGYSRIIGAPEHHWLQAAAWNLRYNSRCFIAPPWEEIYAQDRERKQTLRESVEVYEMMVAVYTEYGYELVEIPRGPISERAGFILGSLS